MHSHRAPDLPTGIHRHISPIYARVRCGWGGRAMERFPQDDTAIEGRLRGLVTSVRCGNAYFRIAPRGPDGSTTSTAVSIGGGCSKRSEGTTSGSPKSGRRLPDTRPRRGVACCWFRRFSLRITLGHDSCPSRAYAFGTAIGRQTARARSVLALHPALGAPVFVAGLGALLLLAIVSEVGRLLLPQRCLSTSPWLSARARWSLSGDATFAT